MPFKSQAQRRKFAQFLVEGKISNQTFEEWNRETGAAKFRSAYASRREVARRSERPEERERNGDVMREA